MNENEVSFTLGVMSLGFYATALLSMPSDKAMFFGIFGLMTQTMEMIVRFIK